MCVCDWIMPCVFFLKGEKMRGIVLYKKRDILLIKGGEDMRWGGWMASASFFHVNSHETKRAFIY